MTTREFILTQRGEVFQRVQETLDLDDAFSAIFYRGLVLGMVSAFSGVLTYRLLKWVVR